MLNRRRTPNSQIQVIFDAATELIQEDDAYENAFRMLDEMFETEIEQGGPEFDAQMYQRLESLITTQECRDALLLMVKAGCAAMQQLSDRRKAAENN